MSFGDSFKQVVATVAPLIGTAFGGPLGGLAGNFLASKLGTPQGDQKALEAKVLSGDPQVMLQIKEANDAFQAHLADLGVEEDRIVSADTANARGREILVHDNTNKVLAYFVIGFTALLEGWVLTHGIPDAVDKILAGRILGTLDSAALLVMGYYFGTSAGSAAKTDVINKIAATK